MRPLVIGIAGGTGSGKTTLARALCARFPGRCEIIGLDSYYHGFAGVPAAEMHRQDFDHPRAFDMPLLVTHLDALRAGRPAGIPRFDPRTHTRSPERRRLDPSDLVVLEGILVLAEPEVRTRLDLRVYVTAPDEVRLERRIRHDQEKRGRPVEAILEQYRATVQPVHEAFVEPSRAHADVLVDGTGDVDEAAGRVAEAVEERLRAAEKLL